jgi:hypothetical protein
MTEGFTRILSILIALPLAVTFLLFVARHFVVHGEDWFLGRNEGSRRREQSLVRTFFKSQIWLHLTVTAVIWFSGNQIGTLIGATYDRVRQSQDVEASTSANLPKPSAPVESSQSANQSDRPSQVELFTQVAAANLACVLARVASVLYHQSLMRGVLLASILFVDAFLMFVLFSVGSERIIEVFPRDELARTVVPLVVVPLVSGFTTEMLLPQARYWGRRPATPATSGAYACVVCGRMATVVDGKLAECTDPRPHPQRGAGGRFRRESAGW